MPQVKGGNRGKSGGSKPAARKPAAGRKSATPARDAVAKQTADASSVLMSIFFLIAIIIGIAAWMGQSISIIEIKANQLADGAAKTVGLSVKTIQIVEVPENQHQRVLDALEIVPGDSMFRADPHVLKERLDAVPGFGGVQVHRFWPNQIKVVATPLETSVMLRDPDSGALQAMHISGEQAVIAEAGMDYDIVEGDGALAAYAALHDSLNNFPAIQTRVVRTQRIGNRRWDLIMASGVRVKLPEGVPEVRVADEDKNTDMRELALQALAALQRETGVLDRQVEMIDLRDPARVFVRRRQLEAGLTQPGRAG